MVEDPGGDWSMIGASAPVLIINADDYGLTAAVNRGIEAAHRAGVVTSTSVMVNQAASAEAADLPLRHPRLGIGIHLNLSLGEPLSAPGQVASLVDREGRFLDRRSLVERLYAGRVAAADVARECAAQLARLRALGIAPDHWNVHQHLQEHPPLTDAVARAMAVAGVRVARCPRRVPTRPALSLGGMRELERARRRRPARRAIAAWHRTPERLLDAPVRRWPALLPRLRGGVIEAICHPGEAGDEELDRLTPELSRSRARELADLVSPELRHALGSCERQLLTFAQAFGDRASA